MLFEKKTITFSVFYRVQNFTKIILTNLHIFLKFTIPNSYSLKLLEYFMGNPNSASTIRLLVLSLRPHQWIKNGFVLVPLLFAQKAFDYQSVMLSIQAFLIFCMLTGAVYLFNDLVDLKSDLKHPVKKHRPLAAGLLSIKSAVATAAVLLLFSIIWGFSVSKGFFVVMSIYIAIQLLYNYHLKNIVILDIFCISAGFFLRVVAGAAVINVEISNWLIICSVLLSMFLALAKRRHELVLLGQEDAAGHRKVLVEYSPYLLDQMIVLIAASTLLSYMLYCISSETIEKFHTEKLIYTFPFVLYGIFRYLYLIHSKNQGSEPEKVIINDLPLLIDFILWIGLCMLIIYKIL